MDASDLRLVYMTARDLAEARALAHRLIEQRLAACVNIIEGMTSLYPWEGRLEETREVVVLAKTTAASVAPLITAVTQQHSYEVPCVLALQVADAHLGYATWLRGLVSAPAGDATPPALTIQP